MSNVFYSDDNKNCFRSPMKPVYLFIEIPAFNLSLIKNTIDNPGIGGTEFSSIRLAHKLLEFDVDLTVVSNTLSSDHFIDDLPVMSFKTFNDARPGICIVPTKFNDCEIHAHHRIIWWSHHPHERPRKEFRELVCLSEYQRLSNISKYSKRISCIPNLPSFQFNNNVAFNNSGSYAIFMGALTPGKGFLDAVPIFNDLLNREIIDGVKVIGGDLYGSGVDEKYMNKVIKKTLPFKTKYQYLGVMGNSKYSVISDARLAIFNPTGRTEAYPATPLEILNQGVMCFGGNDYGSTEHYRHFPELGINPSDTISKKVQKILALIDDHGRQRHVLEKVNNYLQLCSDEERIIYKWLEVLNSEIDVFNTSCPSNIKLRNFIKRAKEYLKSYV